MGSKYVISDVEEYLFDLTGYLVVRDALAPEEVDECNRAIDHFADEISKWAFCRGTRYQGASPQRRQPGAGAPAPTGPGRPGRSQLQYPQLFCFGLDAFDRVFKRYQPGAVRSGPSEVLVLVDGEAGEAIVAECAL